MKNMYKLLAMGLLFTACSQQVSNSETKVVDPLKGESSEVSKKELIMEDLLVAFWNVENLFDFSDDKKTNDNDFLPEGKYEWTEKKYNQKLDRLSTVLNDLGEDLPHLVGLAEVENLEVLKDLALHDDMVKGNYKIIHKDSKDQRGIDVALLFNSNYLSEISHEFLDIDSHSEKALFSRDILHAKFLLASGSVLHYFVNHWPSRRDGAKETEHKRLAAAKTLKAKVDQILDQNPDAQIIISGDFNDYPDNKSLSSVLGARSIKEKGAKLVNLAYELDKKDKGTITYKGDWGMFDQFIVSSSLLDRDNEDVKKQKMRIFDEDYVMYFDKTYNQNQPSKFQGRKFYGGYSDHLAVYLTLKIK